MPGFLASVKNIEEAKKICELDIDIVDFKKVDDGALGFVGSDTVRQVRKLLHNHVISVTMGNDLNPYNESYINNINLTIQNNIEYLKIGLFDISMISEHKKLIEETEVLTKKLRNDMDNQNLNNYIKSVINISFLTNKYINDEEPWKLKKTDINKMNNILHTSLEQIAKISILLNPIIPIATQKVLEALNLNTKLLNMSFLDGKKILKDEIKIEKIDILFKKIA